MPKGKNRKTKKFLKYYGPEYVEEFEEEKRKREEDTEKDQREVKVK